MYCKNFMAELPENADVCLKCGTIVRKVEADITPKSNDMSILGFICSFFIPLLGWIFGGIGLSAAAKRGGKGRGLSIAAIIISTIVFIISIVEFIDFLEYISISGT